MLTVIAATAAALTLAVTFYIFQFQAANQAKRTAVLASLGISPSRNVKILGFFHPYCNAGGGGERVLWTAIKAMQQTEPNVINVVYSGDIDASKAEIIEKVRSRFDIDLDSESLHFVFLTGRKWVEDQTWPRFTLIGQSIGSMYLAWEAMSKLIPDLYIDTMGYAFTFHVVWLLSGVPIGAYIHYPTISTDMLARVKSRKSGVTNDTTIATSMTRSAGKLLYYRLFMYYYALSLRRASFLMVNSSWTKNHIDDILKHHDRPVDLLHWLSPLILLRLLLSVSSPSLERADIVYPPCDTTEMMQLPLEGRDKTIISIAQFRPEKDHTAQVLAFYELMDSQGESAGESLIKLVLIGGSRNADDAARVEELKKLAEELKIRDRVEFMVNASYPDMLAILGKASMGINTMVDEHFGINVVEYMAAGVIPIVHASGGPLHDIVVPVDGQPTGYHATTPATYADAFRKVLAMSNAEELALRTRTRGWAIQRFSEAEFVNGWQKSGWKRCLS